MTRRALRAAVFDLDGTLVNSLPVTFLAMREAVRPFLGRDLSDAEIYAHFGPADQVIVRSLVRPGEGDEAERRLMAAYERHLADMPLFPGIAELLDDLRGRGLSLALCTGRGRPSTDLVFRTLRLDRWFELSVTGEEAGLPKPAPDGVLLTCRRLGVTGAEILYTGDSVKDVEAGLAAGALTVAALWGDTEGEAPGFGRAHLQARHPAEITRFLGPDLAGDPGL